MPFNQALDSNGRAIQALAYDPTTHQPIMPLSGPAVIDPSSGIAYAPDGAAQLDGFKASYAAAIGGLVGVTGCTDLFTLTNPAASTKTIRITRCDISGGVATAAQQIEVYGIVRSAVNTGGSSTSPTAVPYDSNDAVATGVVRAYTANPASLGTTVGTVRVAKMLLVLSTGATSFQDRLIWDFGDRPTKALVLRAGQVFAINLNTVAFANATSFNVYIEWTEDSYS